MNLCLEVSDELQVVASEGPRLLSERQAEVRWTFFLFWPRGYQRKPEVEIVPPIERKPPVSRKI